MAALTFTGSRYKQVNDSDEFTLTASDTFELPSSGTALAVITNGSGGSLTILMTGQDMPKNVDVAGFGSAVFNNLSVTVADGETKVVNLSLAKNILTGTVTVTGGTGAKVNLLSSYN